MTSPCIFLGFLRIFPEEAHPLQQSRLDPGLRHADVLLRSHEPWRKISSGGRRTAVDMAPARKFGGQLSLPELLDVN